MKTKSLSPAWPFPTGTKPLEMTSVNESQVALKQSIKDYTTKQLEKAKLLNVGIVHIKDSYNPKGGLTVAFRKISPYKSGRMVEVSVASCAITDTFSRKTGTQTALAKFFNGETIQLPLLNTYTKEDLSWVVKESFTNFYANI